MWHLKADQLIQRLLKIIMAYIVMGLASAGMIKSSLQEHVPGGHLCSIGHGKASIWGLMAAFNNFHVRNASKIQCHNLKWKADCPHMTASWS